MMTDSLNLGYKITMCKNANINHEFKGQGHTEVKYCMTTYFIGKKICGPNIKPCQKPYSFDIEVKG